MFNLTTYQHIYAKQSSLQNYSWFETDFGEDFARLRWTLFLPLYQRQYLNIEDFIYISVICEARSVRSSVCIKISLRVRQRYFVFVSTVGLQTLYIQERPYMNTFCECILKKIGPTQAHFQYNARKLMSLKSVLL